MKTGRTIQELFTIEVFRQGGSWVFDDERVGLVREPFVAGADTLIDVLAKGCKRITITFSTIPFPSHKFKLEKAQAVAEVGTYYHAPAFGHDLWLCPALNLYYPVSPGKGCEDSPETIYIDYKTL